MNISGMMQTSVSGMNAQSVRLATVSDNIANSDTVGYKKKNAHFSTLVVPGPKTQGNPGGVLTLQRQEISGQGVLQSTTSSTDLAISGAGFFVVQDRDGTSLLTRAGSFIMDDEGRLVNAAGYVLAGEKATGGTGTVANSFAGLEPIVIDRNGQEASPSRTAEFIANFPADANIVSNTIPVGADPDNYTIGDLPSANDANSKYTNKSSIQVFDDLGRPVLLDLYFTKTGDNEWEVDAFDRANAGDGSSPFPYTDKGTGAATGPLATTTLSFDGTTGKLTNASANFIDIPVPLGQTVKMDLSGSTQFGSAFNVFEAQADGSAPYGVETIEIDDEGTLFAFYADGSRKALYKIPLADVPSPDNLNDVTGTAFTLSDDSGDVLIGFAGQGHFGTINAGNLEQSTVDVAEELTSMIQSQRSYTANSKVFQTSSEVLDVIVNLKR